MRNKIKEFVQSRNLSVYKFWKTAGISHQTAYDLYHKPEQLPSPDVIRKICGAFEVQPNELMEWVAPEPTE